MEGPIAPDKVDIRQVNDLSAKKGLPVMDIRKVTEMFSVAPQIEVDDVAELAALGYQGLICNRPDGEGPDQPEIAAVRAAAEKVGITVRYVPVSASGMTAEDIKANAAALDELSGPVLGYCRSGMRSIGLWAQDQILNQGADADAIIAAAADAGFNLSGLRR